MAAQKAMASVNPERMRAHVKFLASDLLEGRGTGQRGGDLAATYIATQFELFGLNPAGDNGSYFQRVPLVGITTEPQSTVAWIPAKGEPISFTQGSDIVLMDESQSQSSQIDAPVVFVGYGIDAPEYQWNDFKDTNVRGKVLLMLVNEPPSDDPKFFLGKALTYYGRWTYKFEEAARKGAAGVLLIHKTEMASYGWQVVQSSWGGERSYLRDDPAPKLKMAAWISYAMANQLGGDVEKLIASANSRDFQPVELPARIKAHILSQVRPFESENVLAMLPGSDAKLRDQAILYSAHFDHLGMRDQGAVIYNGAVDNGTGCGILLEIAHAYAQAPQAPPRSILFAAVTGEEQGLLGSAWLGQHPPIPAGKIELALNFDALPPIGIPESIDITGAERTTFYPVVARIAQQLHLAIEPDPDPGGGHYYRSDHFSFARAGIPAFSIGQGVKFQGHESAWGVSQQKDYTAHRYHQPGDKYQANWDFAGNAKIARFGIALGWAAADTPQLIGWQKGDEFEAAREKSQK